MTWVGMNLLQPLNCLNVVGLGEQSCVHGRAKSSGLIFPAQVASSQTEGMRASDHGRGHNFSVLFHCNISVICCLLSFSLIIPSSPDFGCIYLLFPHPFILLPLSFTFNPHPFIPSSRIPVAQTHVCQDREREQILRNNSVCDNEVHRVVVPGMFLLAETGEDLEEEQFWGSLTLACN